MAVDYISTEPWNDPYNPWPGYSTIPVVSSIYIRPTTLQLTLFNPYFEIPIKYEGMDGYNNIGLFFYGGSYNIEGLWAITLDNTPQYSSPASIRGSRSLPMKMPGGDYGWENQDTDNVETLYISAPDLNSLAPWELRRLWNLNG